MKANFVIAGGRMNFELEAGSAKELFEQIAEVQTTFDVEHNCGLCGSDHVQFNVREEEGKGKQKGQQFKFYELRCQGMVDEQPCRARFDFGQSMDTKNLFPKRKDDDGNVKGKRGWYRYVPQNGQQSEPAPAQRTEAPRQAPAPRMGDTGTPDGLQPAFDRLAELFSWKVTPTRISDALDRIRESFEREMGAPAVTWFDELYRGFCGSVGEKMRDKPAYLALIKKTVDYYHEERRTVA